jgi:hypothetical protein
VLSPHNLFSIAGVATEIAVVGLLLHRRIGRTLPVFLVYCIWALLSDSVMLVLSLAASKGYNFNFYAVSTTIDSAMQFSLLVELAWSVLRPVRSSLSPKAVWGIAALMIALGAAIWPFATVSGVALPSRAWYLLMQMQQTVSIMRVAFFLLLVACGQLLGLGWRDRELQVATGFGFYSLVSLGVAAVTPHLATKAQMVQLYWVVAFSFLGSLVYWVVSFAQQEAPRREFTPETKQMLMTVAQFAHVARLQFSGMEDAKQESLQ